MISPLNLSLPLPFVQPLKRVRAQMLRFSVGRMRSFYVIISLCQATFWLYISPLYEVACLSLPNAASRFVLKSLFCCLLSHFPCSCCLIPLTFFFFFFCHQIYRRVSYHYPQPPNSFSYHLLKRKKKKKNPGDKNMDGYSFNF